MSEILALLEYFKDRYDRLIDLTNEIIISKDVIISNLKGYDSIIKKLEESNSLNTLYRYSMDLDEIIEDVKVNSENLSEQYEQYIIRQIGQNNIDQYGYLNIGIKERIQEYISFISEKKNDSINGQHYLENKRCLEGFLSYLEHYIQVFITNISALKVFNNINIIEGNAVLIGANGSGKSRFANQLKKLHTSNITIIAAQYILFYKEEATLQVDSNPLQAVRSYQEQEKLLTKENEYGYKDRIISEFDVLIKSLKSEHNDRADEYYRGLEKQESILTKIMKIWNSIIEHKELTYEKHKMVIRTKDAEDQYDFNELSDGEKAVFYYISQVLIAKDSNYIIVDEPENHINLAICNLLWDKLEQIRDDCVFVYLTHNVDFAVSRVGAKLYWNKEYNYPDNWQIESLSNKSELPQELLVELAGSRKKILFCEGTKSSLDYKIYSALFEEDYTIIPVENHLNVISYTQAFNRINIFKTKAVGLIDRDYHETAQITSWKGKGIYALKFLEVENFLCNETILNHFIKMNFIRPDQVESFKEELFEELTDKIETLVKQELADRMNNYLKNNLINSNLSNDVIKQQFMSLPDSFNVNEKECNIRSKYQKISESKSYLDYLMNINMKNRFLKEFIPKHFGIMKYDDKVILQIRNDDSLKEDLKKQFFEEL